MILLPLSIKNLAFEENYLIDYNVLELTPFKVLEVYSDANVVYKITWLKPENNKILKIIHTRNLLNDLNEYTVHSYHLDTLGYRLPKPYKQFKYGNHLADLPDYIRGYSSAF